MIKMSDISVGRLLSFEVHHDGSVIIEVVSDDPADPNAHYIMISYTELQGIAEASRVRRE